MVLSVVFYIDAIRRLQHGTGPFFSVSLALSGLALAILFTIPSKSIRLFAKRVLAFVIDLTLLGLFTYAIFDNLFKSIEVRPSALLSLIIVWAWFLIFVWFDWRYAGTPGKLLLGLRLKSGDKGAKLLVTVLLRDLLILIVPLVGPGWLLILQASGTKQFAEWSIGIALLSLIPLSIAFSGGQSIPDLYLGVTVLPKGTSALQYPAQLRKLDWLLLGSASLLFGVFFSYAWLILNTHFMEGQKLRLIPPLTQIGRGELDSKVALFLRSYLQTKISVPDDFLQDVQVIPAVGDISSESTESTVPPACREVFKTKKPYLIVRIQIPPQTPIAVTNVLYEGIVQTAEFYTDRPSFIVYEIASRDSLGVFDVEFSEFVALCLMKSGEKRESLFVDLDRAITVPVSLNEPTVLLLGKLDAYSEVEKVPIWFHNVLRQ